MGAVVDLNRGLPRRLSILNSAVTPDTEPIDQDTGRWQNGWRAAPECPTGGVADPCSIGNRSDLIPPRADTIEGEPFVVWAGDRCSALGWQAGDYQGRAERALAQCESKQIGAEFWTGTLSQAAGWSNQRLASPAADTVTDGPEPALGVLACLESAIAECSCGATGMIHATAQLVTHWAGLGPSVMRIEGNTLVTVHGTIVVADAGYDGSAPDGTPATASQWAYATGLVTVRRSPVDVLPGEFSEALDRATNTVEWYAQRLATVAWDGCCHFAAEANIAPCLIGGAS